ncbi:MAG TPA: hypothetical protein V6D19_16115 [Stenomitos sp.]
MSLVLQSSGRWWVSLVMVFAEVVPCAIAMSNLDFDGLYCY